MGGELWMGEEPVDGGRIRPKCNEQKTGPEREVLQKVPEQRPSLSGVRGPEVPGFPKLLPQQGGRAAIACEHEAANAIRKARDHPQRHKDFNTKTDDNQAGGQLAVSGDFTRLCDRSPEIEQLVQCAERQKQQDQDNSGCGRQRDAQNHDQADPLDAEVEVWRTRRFGYSEMRRSKTPSRELVSNPSKGKGSREQRKV